MDEVGNDEFSIESSDGTEIAYRKIKDDFLAFTSKNSESMPEFVLTSEKRTWNAIFDLFRKKSPELKYYLPKTNEVLIFQVRWEQLKGHEGPWDMYLPVPVVEEFNPDPESENFAGFDELRRRKLPATVRLQQVGPNDWFTVEGLNNVLDGIESHMVEIKDENGINDLGVLRKRVLKVQEELNLE